MMQMLDIVGSTIIGGIMLILILQLNSNMVETASVQTMNTSTQENLTTFTGMLEYDFNKIGYRVTDSLKITTADTSKIIFNSDSNNSGKVDTVSYYLASVLDTSTTNPRDRLLFRVFNQQTPQAMRLGVTRFRLWYYDSLGQVTSVRSKIRAVRLAINLESPEPYDALYTGGSWERTMKPRNLR